MKTCNSFRIGLCALALLPLPSAADDTFNQYMQNWGAYAGFDITQPPPNPPPVSTLISVTNTGIAEQVSLLTLFGALLVNASNGNLAAFVPNGSPYSGLLNPLSNSTFSGQTGGTAYNSTSSTTNGVTVSPLLNQATYQNNPVTQSILDTLTTPDVSYCLSNDKSTWLNPCPYPLYSTLVTYNALGNAIPGPTEYFSYAYNQPVLSELNSAALLGPLQYSTGSTTTSGSSSQNTTNNAGLTATNQMQAAHNFIQYLSSVAIKPSKAPGFNTYNKVYMAATDTSTSATPSSVLAAQSSIMDYVGGVRSYAAQLSVPLNNLYGMLSNRMPQTGGSSGNSTSQAMSLFQLATWRLYNPNNQPDGQWINQLNQASNATVQKEIAATLADILYVLYVLHQDNERQLLTTSVGVLNSLSPPTFSPPADQTTI